VSGVDDELAQADERAARTGAPVVVVLDGPGATGAAARFVAGRTDVVSHIASGALPDEVGPGRVVWFHDSLGAADRFLIALWLWPADRVVLLTGTCADAGPEGHRIRLFAEGEPGAGGWVQCDDPPGPADADAVRAAIEAGDWAALSRGIQRAELEHRPIPPYWRAMRCLGLRRMRQVPELLLHGAPPSGEERVLLGAALMVLGQYARGERVLGDLPDDPDVLADARSVLGTIDHVLRGLPAADLPMPATAWRRAHIAFVRAGERGSAEHLAAITACPAVAAALLAEEATYGARPAPVPLARAFARIGWLEAARRVVARWNPLSLSLASPRERGVLEALAALHRGDVEGASRWLDLDEALLADGFSLWPFAWWTTRALVAALRGDASALVGAIHRVQGMGDFGASEHFAASEAHTVLAGHTSWCARRLIGHYHDRGAPGLNAWLTGATAEDLVLGDYALRAVIGRGAMGEVWSGVHPATGMPVAVKLLPALATASAERAFHAEIEVVSRLEHPSIVGVLDFGIVPASTASMSGGRIAAGRPFLVMERVDGGTLAERLASFSWAQVRDVALALLDALAYAHATDVVHRDLKPANVLVTGEGRLRLTDFGIAALDTARVAGTPTYMAPEQFAPRWTPDPRADLYALGCLVWGLVTGAPPFIGTPAQLQRAHGSMPLPKLEPAIPVPAGLRAWLGRLLAKNPAERFPHAAATAEALLELPDAGMWKGGQARTDGGDTFDLTTMIDLPADTFEYVTSDRPASMRISAVFHRERPYRPRVPTTRLLGRGDPEVIGHLRARTALWDLLQEVLGTGEVRHVVLEGPRGVGRRSLVRELRLKARLVGLTVAERPGRGLSVVDAAEVDDAPIGPCLMVWTRGGGPPDAVRSTLSPLSRVELYWVVRSRLAVSPSLGLAIARRSGGSAGLAVRLVESVVRVPGLRAGPRGLEPLRWLRDEEPVARAWWDQELAGLRAEERTALEAAASLMPGFLPSSWRALLARVGQTVDDALLERFGDRAGSRWSLHPEVRQALWERMPLEARRTWQRHAAELDHHEADGPVRRAFHRASAARTGGHEVLAAEVARALVHCAELPAGVLDALETQLDLAGVPTDAPARGWLWLGKAIEQPTLVDPRLVQGERCRSVWAEAVDRRGGQHGRGWLEVEVAALPFARVSDVEVAGTVRRAAASGDAGLRVRAASGALLHSTRRGRGHREVALRLEACAARSAPEEVGWPSISYAQGLTQAGQAARGRDVLRSAELSLRDGRWPFAHALVCCQLADAELLSGQVVQAAEVARRGVGIGGFIGALCSMNLALAEGLLGRTAEALEAAWDAVMLAHGPRSRLMESALLVILALERDWPSAHWDDLFRCARPNDDPTLIALLEKAALDLEPVHPRRADLLDLVERCRSASVSPASGVPESNPPEG
jgi:serine/threonine protein kinase